MPYTYPPAAPSVSGDVTSIHTLLQRPELIARRLREIAEQRFIADALLTGRFTAVGGAIQFEQGESIYTDRAPQQVRPGAEYPMTPIGMAPTQIAEVQKWGQDVPVTDEAIKRLLRNPVDRAFAKLVNHMVKTVDSVALAVIASQITNGAAVSGGAWTAGATTVESIFLDVALAKAAMHDLNDGFDPDAIVVTEQVWARVMAKFVGSGLLPREAADTPLLTGDFPVIGGVMWLTSPNVPTTTAATLVDREQLGGMADEDLGGPGYSGALNGVETKSIRDEEKDGYRLRARRVTVPVVLEPGAGYEITGVSA